MVKKNRPKAEVAWSDGIDGRDGHYYIAYYCPACHRRIRGYRSETACDACGKFYDWGKREPRIEIKMRVEWDEQ